MESDLTVASAESKLYNCLLEDSSKITAESSVEAMSTYFKYDPAACWASTVVFLNLMTAKYP